MQDIRPILEKDGGPKAAGWVRWVVCLLLFAATTINYMDRQVIGLLKPELDTAIGWSEAQYGHIVTSFQLAYALGYLFTGRLIDKLGVRIGLALAVSVWSLAAMAHGVARTVMGFAIARFGLGLSEGGNFPAAIKAVSEWFPKKERALATGLFNSGANIGAVITPIAVPLIVKYLSWPWAFYLIGGLGFVFLGFWLWLYYSPRASGRVSQEELAYIESDPADPPVEFSWLELLRYRPTWAFAVGMAISSPIWWFYLYWIPDFLYKQHGVKLLAAMLPLVVIYQMTTVGSIGGGWLSSSLIKRGWSINAARKIALLVCALCVVPICGAAVVASKWTCVLLIGLAAAAHQGFAANLFTIVSDTMPRKTVSSVVGIGGFAGAIGGMFFAEFAGHILEWFPNHGYIVLFGIASTAYLFALLFIQLLVPRLEPVTVDLPELDNQA